MNVISYISIDTQLLTLSIDMIDIEKGQGMAVLLCHKL